MTPPRLTQPKSLDDMLLYVLWRLQATSRRPVVRLCESEFGITRREWRMLAQLGQVEGLASSALAERAALDRAQTSRAVGSLVAKQLVARTPRPGDRREVLLHLTDAGRVGHDDAQRPVDLRQRGAARAGQGGGQQQVSAVHGVSPRRAAAKSGHCRGPTVN